MRGSIPFLLLIGLAPAAGAQAPRATTITVSAGLGLSLRDRTPISDRNHSIGASYSLAFGRRLGSSVISPRVGVSYDTSPGEPGYAETGQLRLETIWSRPPSGPVRLLPFLTTGIDGYAGRYRCDPPIPTGAACRGSARGFGWHLSAGLLFPADRGAGASVTLRYFSNPRLFDGLALTLDLSL
jgi:hypothetical protein